MHRNQICKNHQPPKATKSLYRLRGKEGRRSTSLVSILKGRYICKVHLPSSTHIKERIIPTKPKPHRCFSLFSFFWLPSNKYMPFIFCPFGFRGVPSSFLVVYFDCLLKGETVLIHLIGPFWSCIRVLQPKVLLPCTVNIPSLKSVGHNICVLQVFRTAH